MKVLIATLFCALLSSLAAAQNPHNQLDPKIKLVDTVVKERTDGTLSEVKVKYGVHKLLDKEAVRVIKSYPKGTWTPATKNGIPVRFMYVIGLDFVLN